MAEVLTARIRLPFHPRPIYGIFVAMMVMNWTFASSGRFAM
jgi:hypothetical protein